jgi:adenylyl- and sulfurtransferase ThiI
MVFAHRRTGAWRAAEMLAQTYRDMGLTVTVETRRTHHSNGYESDEFERESSGVIDPEAETDADVNE